MNEREFKGVWLPASLFLHPDLSPLEKILWADIDSFTSNDAVFYKSNATIADQYGVGQRTITKAIKNLVNLGLIGSRMKQGRQRVLFSCEAVSQNVRGSVADSARQGRKFCEAGSQNVRQRVTIENTIENTNLDKEELPWSSELFLGAWDEWLNYRKESKFKTTSRSLRASLTKLINLSDGNEHTAIEIINDAIAHSWKGFYKITHHGKQRTITRSSLNDFVNQR